MIFTSPWGNIITDLLNRSPSDRDQDSYEVKTEAGGHDLSQQSSTTELWPHELESHQPSSLLYVLHAWVVLNALVAYLKTTQSVALESYVRDWPEITSVKREPTPSSKVLTTSHLSWKETFWCVVLRIFWPTQSSDDACRVLPGVWPRHSSPSVQYIGLWGWWFFGCHSQW